MKTFLKPLRLAQLLLACGFAPAFAAALPPCTASNYDAKRDLFTLDKDNTSLDVEHVIKSQIVNQQCLLTIVPRSQAGRLRDSGPNSTGEMVEGRYMMYLSNGGDGGSGGSARPIGGMGGGGGGGGAGAAQVRQEVVLTPGQYKLTLGAGGPGGAACRGTFGGGPGWGGSPTGITRLADGVTVAGVPGADTWQRPTRLANEKRSGPADGHGGGGPGKSAGGDGSKVDPGFATVAQAGTASPGAAGKPGDAGGEVLSGPGPAMRVGGGGGGGAGLGDGGDGAGNAAGQVAVSAPEVGGLGAGGGGGAGRTNFCSAGAPGGNGYIALRRR